VQTNESNSSTTETPAADTRYHVFAFAEAFRFLHANLSFVSPDRPLNSLVVSSATLGEGKTTVACNLAQTAAQMGKRVLLVDADLRRPQVHQVMQVSSAWGLSNVISAEELSFTEAIQAVPGLENLHVLTAGQLPPDPTPILASQQMRQAVETWQESYDLIVFDTPPVLELADAKLLAVHTNGLVMVARMGVADCNDLKQVLESLRMSRVSLLGAIANSVKPSNSGNYSYYYHYYYSRNTSRSYASHEAHGSNSSNGSDNSH
jgi:capsular exopolysaccharide synthesis family protein